MYVDIARDGRMGVLPYHTTHDGSGRVCRSTSRGVSLARERNLSLSGSCRLQQAAAHRLFYRSGQENADEAPGKKRVTGPNTMRTRLVFSYPCFNDTVHTRDHRLKLVALGIGFVT